MQPHDLVRFHLRIRNPDKLVCLARQLNAAQLLPGEIEPNPLIARAEAQASSRTADGTAASHRTCVARLNSMGGVDGQPTARMSCRKVMAGGNYCFRADERRAVERRSRSRHFATVRRGRSG